MNILVREDAVDSDRRIGVEHGVELKEDRLSEVLDALKRDNLRRDQSRMKLIAFVLVLLPVRRP
jgi:hypothetical protein